MKLNVASVACLTLLLAGLAYARPTSPRVDDEKLLYLQCHSISSPVTDFAALSRLLNHPSNQKAVFKVGLEKLAVFLEEFSPSQQRHLTRLLQDGKVDDGDSVILHSYFDESSNWYYFPKTKTFVESWTVFTKWMDLMGALHDLTVQQLNESQCPCKLCFQDSEGLCISISLETANQLNSY